MALQEVLGEPREISTLRLLLNVLSTTMIVPLTDTLGREGRSNDPSTARWQRRHLDRASDGDSVPPHGLN